MKPEEDQSSGLKVENWRLIYAYFLLFILRQINNKDFEGVKLAHKRDFD